MPGVGRRSPAPSSVSSLRRRSRSPPARHGRAPGLPRRSRPRASPRRRSQIVPGASNRTTPGPRRSVHRLARPALRPRDDQRLHPHRGPERLVRPIDRLELNTIAARLGRMKLGTVSVDGGAVHATVERPDDRRPARRAPSARCLDHGRASTTARRCAERWRVRLAVRARRTGSSTCTAGSPGSACAAPFDRPNHGDPFLTVASPLVRVDDHDRPAARHRRDRPAGRQAGPRPDVRGARRPRHDDHGQPVLPAHERDGRVDERPRLRQARLPRRDRPGLREDGDREDGRAGRDVSVSHVYRRPVGRRRRDGVARAFLDPRRPRPARTCAGSSPTRPPTSGSTGSSGPTRRASPSPTRRWPTSWHAT